jgi:selenide,water dikinase
MKMLNKRGGEIMSEAGVRGATDITGFGLAGHALKMAQASNVSISLIMNDVPLIEEAYDLINEGCIPGASFRNLEYCEKETHFSPGLDYNLKMVAFDAQTSGGLFISVNESKAESLLQSLHEAGLLHSRIIGKVTEKGNSNLILL